MRTIVTLALLLAGYALPSLASSGESRIFEFTYQMTAADLPSSEAVDVYIPRPGDQPGQQILDSHVSATFALEEGWESRYQNGYYHLHRPANVSTAIELKLSWTVNRDTVLAGADRQLSPQQREQLPLNYFIYPYVEVGGKPWGEKLDTRFHYTEID